MPYSPKTKDWFIQRIGKRIYRNSQSPDHDNQCSNCRDVSHYGLTVRNEPHAEYLAMIDADFASEGIISNYRDEL